MNRWLSFTGSFADAAEWFGGQSAPTMRDLADGLSRDASSLAQDCLSRVCFNSGFLELLPYALDTHGPGSRLSVMRDPSTQTARNAKRRSGIFYTPGDVAEYMAKTVLRRSSTSSNLRILDPSCGTGVFFVAVLQVMSQERQNGNSIDLLGFATRSFYGLDVSPLAIDSCAFVLLHHCIDDVNTRGVSPWAAWHALRLNLAATDALRIQVPSGRSAYAGAARSRENLRDCLLDPKTATVERLIENLAIPPPLQTAAKSFT